MSVRHAESEARTAGRRASGSKTLRFAARGGLVARGVVYVLVGSLAMRIAFGQGGKEADRTGALQTVAKSPGGGVLLWLIAAGFAGLALWRYAEAAYGQPVADGTKPSKRLFSLARGVFYTVVCGSTIAFALGSGGSQSSNEKSKDATGQAMHDVPAGRWLVLVVGLAFVAAGIGIAIRAIQRKFRKRLDLTGASPRTRKVVETLGMVGRTSRGVLFAAAGVFFAYAAITFDPGKAQGVDGTLRRFADTPAGPWLLVVIALGVITFGVYSWCEARYRKVEPRQAGQPAT
jgi:hypothetical protein